MNLVRAISPMLAMASCLALGGDEIAPSRGRYGWTKASSPSSGSKEAPSRTRLCEPGRSILSGAMRSMGHCGCQLRSNPNRGS
jgi:hypothetical protein